MTDGQPVLLYSVLFLVISKEYLILNDAIIKTMVSISFIYLSEYTNITQ